jgi:uncharacterized phosphatase
MPMNICLIRHGETDWNKIDKMQGREDIPLNQTGIEQAERCGLALTGQKWEAVVTSPLSRARQTAEIIAEMLGIQHIFEDRDLMERDYGKATGLIGHELPAHFPDGSYEGMEDWETLRDRVIGAIKRSADRFYPKDIIIVSHGSAINSILAELSGHSIGSGKTRLKNACINMLEYENSILKIVFYNKTSDELINEIN